MELESSLQKLSVGVLTEMKRMNYAKGTIHYNSRFIAQYSEFVVSIGQNDKFSETLAKRFLKEQYNYPSKEVCSPLPLKIAAAVRVMRLLGEIRAYGAFVKKPNGINIDWAMEDIGIINSYVESMQTRNNSEATKKLRIADLPTFY